MLTILIDDGGWMSATALADRLGVSTRSIRSYVTAINERTADSPVILSAREGYRVHRASLAALPQTDGATGAPPSRVRELLSDLLRDGVVDLLDWATVRRVSDTTAEADLARARVVARETGEIRIVRSGWDVTLVGREPELRRLMLRLVREELPDDVFHPALLARAFAMPDFASRFGRFKADLTAEATALGYLVNEFAAADASLHVAIAVSRVSHGHRLATEAPTAVADVTPLAAIIARLAETAFDQALENEEATVLAALLRERVVPRVIAATDDGEGPRRIEAAVREAARTVGREYSVDLRSEAFLSRLARHVIGVVRREPGAPWTPNPLTRSIKSSYPMVFDIAVSLAGELTDLLGSDLGVQLTDDDITYIAMHVGGEVQRHREGTPRLRAAVVCPGYYEMPELLSSRIAADLGHTLEVTEVITRIDPDWQSIDADLVLTTIEPPRHDERTVRIAPFLNEAELDRIGQIAARVRRSQRLSRLRRELQRYVVDGAYLRGLDGAGGTEEIIRDLGGLLREAGVVDDDHIESAIERERMSSTAFTESMAMPHALQMTARRTALAIGVADNPIPWGDGRVSVVVFAAFSADDRPAFQTVLEQFVEVFSHHHNVERLVRRSGSLSSFLDELVAIIAD